ncbi:MAG: heat-inducible transcriptional repressor HrcA, partial [Bacilli bacterium]|nr:heat-inducible transcriptional repressor HrcA [Bacilli bacterium]
MQELNRKQRILKLIVEEFVKTAEPVGSHSLIDKYNLPYSSATIRSEMAELENLGYLEKTHTSSGRVPSPMGYRYYVDSLREKNCIDDDTKEKIQALFSQKDIQINEVIKHGCEIISQMTNLTSVMLGPDSNEECLSKVQLMPLTSTSAVALFVTDRGHVEHKIFSIPDSIAMNDLENCVEILNDRISGTKISQVVDKVNSIKPILADAVKQHEVIFK